MSDPTASFVLALRDQMSGPAGSARSALEALRTEIVREQKGLRELEAAMKRVHGGAVVNVAAHRRLAEQIQSSKNAIASAQARYVALGGTFGETAAKQKSFMENARRTPGVIGRAAGMIDQLREVLGGTGGRMLLFAAGGVIAVGSLLALGAAAVATAAAFGTLTAAVIRYGIASADARRNEALHLEGLTRMRGASRFAAMSSGAIVSAIDRVSGVAAIGRSEITGYAESLYRLGVRGTALDQALEAASIAAAAGGDAAGRRFLGLAAGAARAGRSVTRVVEEARARFGSVNARLNAGLDRQATRLRESIAALFGGPRVAAAMERFLTRLNAVGSVFSEASAGGRALRTIVEALFPDIIDGAGDALGAVRRLFLTGIILATRAATAFIRTRTAIRALFRSEAGTGFLAVLGPILAGLSPLLTMAAAGVAFVAMGFRALFAQFQNGLAIWGAFFALVGRASSFISSIDWAELGGSIAAGLVRGITGGRDAVVGAIRGLAGDARTALTDALGIRSPSRVFAEYGVHVAGGLAAGVETGAPRVERAVAEVVPAPTSTSSSSSASSRSDGGGIRIEGNTFILQGSTSREQAESFLEQLADLLEGRVLVAGGA